MSFSMEFIRDLLLLPLPLLFAVKDQISQLTPGTPEACARVGPCHWELSMPHGPKDEVVPGPSLPLLTSPGKGPDAKSRNYQRDIFGDFSALLKSKCFKANCLPWEKFHERENTGVLSQTRLIPGVQQRSLCSSEQKKRVTSPIQCTSKEDKFYIA